MEKVILPGPLNGSVNAPCSKSELHRALIFAALCEGETVVECAVPPSDITATVSGLQALGTPIEYRDKCFYVNRICPHDTAVVDCGESGSTLRFLMPLAAALGIETRFLCRGSLAGRPMQPVLDVLKANGCSVQSDKDAYFLRGSLRAGSYAVDASLSSQFLSGLLMVLPLLPGSGIIPSKAITSRSYVNLTRSIAERFGVVFSCTDGRYQAAGTYATPGHYIPEGDWSAAAYWLVANALGGNVAVKGLRADSVQGDRAAARLIGLVCRGGAVIDAGNVPDLVPPLAVLASVTPGETRFVNAGHLRYKESDRLAAVTELLNVLGGDCRALPDGLAVRGVEMLRGGTADSHGDHRIAMAAAIAAAACASPVRLRGAESVEKSYPSFWPDFESLGRETE